MSDSRVIVLTGASRGLGEALAHQLAELGHRVFGCARSARAIGELNEGLGPPHDFQVVDVCDDRQVEQWAKHVLDQARAPDLLLNNAAVINQNAPLWEVPPDEFAQVIDVGVKGVYHVVRHFLPAMIQREEGVVINFSSAWGRSVAPDVAPYCAVKWAIEGMTQALAEELPYGLAAIPLNPGIIHTDMLKSCFGADAAGYASPRQWAKRAVPFLLDLNARHNGHPLTVPG